MEVVHKPTRREDDPLLAIFQQETTEINTPAARRALQVGILEAKREAMQRAGQLVQWGRPLLIGIVAVSFLHLWDTIAAIKPAFVQELHLPEWAYHATAAALTLIIDAAALFCVSAGAALQFAGASLRRNWGVSFFLLTTFLLNAAFVVRHAPALPVQVREAILPSLETVFAALIPAMVPIGICAVERMINELHAARLKLLVETTTLEELMKPTTSRAQNASGCNISTPPLTTDERSSLPDAPIVGGRTPNYHIDDMLAMAGSDGIIKRSEVIKRFSCSEATANRLLNVAREQGLVERIGRGAYRCIDTTG